MHELMKLYLTSGRTRFINSTTLMLFRHSPGFVRRWVAYGLYAVGKNRLPKKRFVIFGQGRAGSTLLVDLMNSHPEIFTFGEIFGILSGVGYPRRYAEGICSLSRGEVCGFKVKIYQLEKRHKLDPGQVLADFHAHGWTIIYLKRTNLLHHAVSDIRSEQTGHYHNVGSAAKPDPSSKLTVELEELLNVMKFREECLRREAKALESLPHLTIEYERDLLPGSRAQRDAMNRVFAALGLSEQQASTSFRKVTSRRMSDALENYEELAKGLTGTPYARFLDA